jgi:hypothetical protein
VPGNQGSIVPGLTNEHPLADPARQEGIPSRDGHLEQERDEARVDLDAEQRRAAEEGLTEDELALFDLLFKDSISIKDREWLKQASQSLLSSLRGLLAPMPGWLQNATTQAQVRVFMLNRLYESVPRPPFTEARGHRVASVRLRLAAKYEWRSLTDHGLILSDEEIA